MSSEIFPLSKKLDAPVRWTAFVGFLGLLGAAIVTVIDVLMRWLFDSPLEIWDDLSHLVFALVIIACFPAGLLQGHNITIRFLGAACGRRSAHWLEWFGSALTWIFFGLVAWQFVVMTVEHRAAGETTMTVKLITWPWWAGATVLVAVCVIVQAVVLAGHWRRALDGDGPGGIVENLDLDEAELVPHGDDDGLEAP